LASAVWFRLNVGRRRKADPKWLIPEICRQGGVTKRAIGAIRIFDEETKFEIDASLAEAFAASIAKVKKGDIFIGETEAPADGGHVRRTPPSHPGAHHTGKKNWKAHEQRGHRDETPARDKPRWTKAKRDKHGDKPHGKARFGGKHSGKPGGFQKQPRLPKHDT
jgi:ATP-dependent RNA helicase DeaD